MGQLLLEEGSDGALAGCCLRDTPNASRPDAADAAVLVDVRGGVWNLTQARPPTARPPRPARPGPVGGAPAPINWTRTRPTYSQARRRLEGRLEQERGAAVEGKGLRAAGEGQVGKKRRKAGQARWGVGVRGGGASRTRGVTRSSVLADAARRGRARRAAGSSSRGPGPG